VKGEAEQWYRKKGIIHQLTTPYTPELNGTIERFMRTTKEMISAMIVDAGFGHGYWDIDQEKCCNALTSTSALHDNHRSSRLQGSPTDSPHEPQLQRP
jgi:transposase InsO family protein